MPKGREVNIEVVGIFTRWTIYSVMRKDKSLLYATTRIELEGVLLSKKSFRSENKCWMFSLISGIQGLRAREQAAWNGTKSADS